MPAQHCHFKQLISRGKNLIISDESSSLFGWKSVVGGAGQAPREGRRRAWEGPLHGTSRGAGLGLGPSTGLLELEGLVG